MQVNMIAEKWKPIEGFPNYQISNIGRVRTFNPYLKSGMGRILKGTLNRAGGYIIVSLSIRGQGRKNKLVSRLVAQAFVHNPNNLPEVHHRDHDKTNNFYLNLDWVTSSQNILYAYHAGRMPYRGGENSPLAVLSEKDVVEMRLMRQENPSMKIKDIAAKFGITPSATGKILRGEQWKHLL